ncbi:MAG: CocE/NonD family hydrolase [Armatimonadota bacterium]
MPRHPCAAARALALLLSLSLGSSLCFAAPRDHADRVETADIPMRDGTELLTDLYFPKAPGPYAILLHRTPYGRGLVGGVAAEAERFLDAGYVVAIQNLRSGAGTKPTVAIFLPDGWGQLQDGYDTVEWLAQQDWSTGSIGTYGASGPGITQYLLAGTGHPALKAQHIGLATPDLYAHACLQGGVLRKSLAEQWLKLVANNWALFEGMLAEHRAYDDLWKGTNLLEVPQQSHAAALHWGGWYDIFNQGTIDAFVALQHRGGEGARGRQRLIMGPWPHGIANRHGDVEFPRNALLPRHMDTYEWFNHYLRGEDTGIEEWPPVAYYVMGDLSDPNAPGNEWREVPDWPPPARPTPLYLREGGLLSWDEPAAEQPDAYDYDPRDPVPTHGGGNLFLPKGCFDQRQVEDRDDVLLYTTEPLEEPLEVTGRILVKLWASSDCVDTDFTAKLTDVYPDGRSLLVLDGILRARFRDTSEQERFLLPGKPYLFTIDLWSTSLIVNRGHRLRLAISSSNYPRFDANPNNGKSKREEGDPKVAHNTIYHDRDRPSHLLLPIPR